ncbi:MAG: oxidoreductase [Jatrophihabitantaceae bacterium]
MTADPLAPLVELAGVADGVAATRAAVDSLLVNRVLRRRSGDVSAESSLRGAWAAAWLSGREHPLDAVRSSTVGADPVLQGALRAYSAIPALADTWTRAPRQVLARLHALAAADLVADSGRLGRPVEQPGVAARLDTLAGVLGGTSAPAVVVAAVVHGELLSLDAFAPVSGILALVAVRLTLIERGLDPKSLVVVEAGHRVMSREYALALDAYRTGTPDGIGRWIAHCADAVVAGARESSAICEAMARG